MRMYKTNIIKSLEEQADKLLKKSGYDIWGRKESDYKQRIFESKLLYCPINSGKRR